MPFVMMGSDGSEEYLAEGISEELIDALTDVEGLQVASWNSSFTLRSEADVRVIARRLGVSMVVEGSVRPSPTGLRVRAELSDATTGFVQWSETFVSEPDEIYAVPERIARALVQELEIHVGEREDAQIVRLDVDDGEAFNLYLRGRYHWNRRTEDDLRRAVSYFKQAVAQAPTLAPAHAGLGDAYAVMGFYDYMAPAEAFQKARAAAKAALDIDPSMGDPHATLGYVALYHDWNWVDSEREFQRAIALDPNYAVAHQWYANYLNAMGRFDDARAANARGLELEPLALIINAVPGWISYYAGDYRRAISELSEVLELDPNFPLAHLWIGQSHEGLGNLDDAIASLERAVTLSSGSDIMVAALAHAYALSGARDTVAPLLNPLEEKSRDRYVPAFEIAKVYVALGDHTAALEWLERAYNARSHSMAFLKVDPQLRDLQSDPEFHRLLARVGHN
jgi:TolB-like protein/Flp pilus assembly protein TadD